MNGDGAGATVVESRLRIEDPRLARDRGGVAQYGGGNASIACRVCGKGRARERLASTLRYPRGLQKKGERNARSPHGYLLSCFYRRLLGQLDQQLRGHHRIVVELHA